MGGIVNFRSHDSLVVTAIVLFCFTSQGTTTAATQGSSVPVVSPCPAGAIYYPGDKTCITLHNGPIDWSAASQACRADGGHLLKLSDKPILDFFNGFIQRYAGTQPAYWIGISDLKKEGRFRWLPEGKFVDFTYWGCGNPHKPGDDQRCGHTWNADKYKWRDANCTEKFAFACQNPSRFDKPLVCSDGWELYDTEGRCVKVFKGSYKTWWNARQACQEEDGDLISITSAGLNNFIKNRIMSQDNDTFYIGMSYNERMEKYTWLDSPYGPTYTSLVKLNYRYYLKEPDSCITTYSSRWWNTRNCNSHQSYICERWAGRYDSTTPTHTQGYSMPIISPCPAGGIYYPRDKTCITLHNEPLNWLNARTYCYANGGGDLVKLWNKPILDFFNGFIQRYAGTRPAYWIGINDNWNVTQFAWRNEITEANFTYWGDGNPKKPGNNQRCGHTWNADMYKWRNAGCDEQLSFACQMDSLVGGPLVCPGGWELYDTEGRCVKVVKGSYKTWWDARQACQEEDGDLISITSADFDNFITDRIKSQDNQVFFIGMSYKKDKKDKRNYVWLDSPYGPTYTSLMELKYRSYFREPGSCVTTYSSRWWNTRNCKSHQSYICERWAGKYVSTKYVSTTSTPTQGFSETTTISPCPAGGIFYPGDRTCITLHDCPKDWQAAREACWDDGGDLLKLSDQSILDFFNGFIQRYAGTQPAYWIGISDSKEGRVKWINEPKEANFTYWGDGFPKKARINKYHCGHTWSADKYKWRDAKCSDMHAFACQTAASHFDEPLVCPDGWELYDTEGRCVKVVKGSYKTWWNARQACQEEDGDLISITSAGLDNFITDRIKSQDNHIFFIGMSYNESSRGNYTWLDSPYGPTYMSRERYSDPFNFKYPDSCVTTYSSLGWKTRDCNRHQSYICERWAWKYVSPPLPVAPCPQIVNRCPGAGFLFPRDQTCIRLYSDAHTWTDARNMCKQDGGDLLILPLEDPAPYEFFISILERVGDGKGDYWFNLNQNGFTDGNCPYVTAKNGYQWHHYNNCNKPTPFACEFPSRLSFVCPNGWTQLNLEGRCFKVVMDQKNYTMARQACHEEGEGGDLALFSKMHETNFIKRSFNLKKSYWIRNRWSDWISDSKVDSVTWKNEPSSPGLVNCVMMRKEKGKLVVYNFAKCEFELWFICERHARLLHCTPQ